MASCATAFNGLNEFIRNYEQNRRKPVATYHPKDRTETDTMQVQTMSTAVPHAMPGHSAGHLKTDKSRICRPPFVD